MVYLKTYRQELEAARNYFFPFIRMWKQTNLNNARDSNIQSHDFLSAIAVNCIVDEILLMIEKKLVNTQSATMKLKLSDAQAVIFYRILIILPVPSEQFYFNQFRNGWIEQLDKQLIEKKIYQQPVQKTVDVIGEADFYFDD